MAMMITASPIVVISGCSSDQTPDGGGPIVFPNRLRPAATTDDTGFQLAKTRNQTGIFDVSTNTLEMKPSRKTGILISTSADCEDLATNPTRIPSQQSANANNSMSRKPRNASKMPFSGRQPT